MSRSLRELIESSPFASSQAPYVEALYEQYLDSPGSLAPAWRQLFQRLGTETPRQPRVTPAAHPGSRPATAITAPAATDTEKQSAVSRLIQFYANRGHLIADIDPLALMSRPVPKVLDPAYVGLTEADLDTEFYTGSRTSGVEKQMTLREILKQLRHVYGGRVGAEFAHVTTSEERLWLQDRFHEGRLQQAFTRDERLNLLWQLSVAEGLERYLHTKYVGQKRFSLEGADALIPLLDDVVHGHAEEAESAARDRERRKET